MNILLLLCLSFFGFAAILYGEVLDGLDSLSGWSTQADAGSSIKGLTLASEGSNKFLDLGYDLGTGSWVEVSKDYSTADFSTGDGIKFSYSGTLASCDVEIKLTDNDNPTDSSKCDKFAATAVGISPDPAAWKTYVINFSSFTTWPDGLGVFDKNKVSRIYIGVKNIAQAGSISFDDIELYKTELSQGETKVDDFENSQTQNNLLGFPRAEAYKDGDSSIGRVFVTTVSYTGSGSMELNYDIRHSTAWAVIVEFLGTQGTGTYDASATDRIEFYIKGKTGNETPQIALAWDGGASKVQITTYGAMSTNWQKYTIPFSAIAGIVPSKLKELKLEFSGATQAGTVYIDEIRFFRPGSTGGMIKKIDALDEELPDTTWQCYSDNGQAVISQTAGNNGNAVKLTFYPGAWSGFERELCPSVKNANAFSFSLCGPASKNGKTYSSNTVEFKARDKDGTTFVKKFSGQSVTAGAWRNFTVPFSEMTFFSKGADENLDLKKIKSFNIAVSKSQGGEGEIYLDDIGHSSEPDLSVSGIAASANLEYVNVPDNPFSPDNNGSKDRASFRFKTKAFSDISLKIMDLSGRIVRESGFGEMLSGTEHEVTWDGKDADGVIVRNGLYIFRLTAKDMDGKESSITNLIGVLK